MDWVELEGPIPDTAMAESTVTRVEPEKKINPENEEQVAKIEEGYARFTQWQKAVDKVAATPENQAKIAEIRKTDRLIDHPVRYYTYADRLEGTPHPKEFGIVGDAKKAASWHPEGDRKKPGLSQALRQPATSRPRHLPEGRPRHRSRHCFP